MHDLLVLQLKHDLHKLSDFGIVYVMVGFIKKSCKIVVELNHLFDFDFLWGLLLVCWEQKASLELRIGFLPALALFLLVLRRFLLIVRSWFLPFFSLRLGLFRHVFLVVNVLGFVGDKCDSVLSPILFYLLGLLLSLWVDYLYVCGVFRSPSFTFLVHRCLFLIHLIFLLTE